MAPESQRQTDALVLLEGLEQVTSPVIINVAEIALYQGAKINTVQKQFSVIKKRYNLNILITTVGATGTTTAVSTPGKTKPTTTPNRVQKPRAPTSTSRTSGRLAGRGNANKKNLDALEDAVNGDDALAEDENVIRWKSESISPATAMILETFEREDQEDDVKTRAKYIEMNEKDSISGDNRDYYDSSNEMV